MKIEETEVYGFKSAFRGMRNPKDSWHYSDSRIDAYHNNNAEGFTLGEKDKLLAQTLIKAGTEHAKFLRFITVWFDMELPLKVHKEMDTYRFIEKNSCSTMHRITSRQLTEEDFDGELDSEDIYYIGHINGLIRDYTETTNQELKQKLFLKITDKLPSSFLQKRTYVTNYQTLRNLYLQRKHHKLPQWHIICNWIEKELPYAKELITLE